VSIDLTTLPIPLQEALDEAFEVPEMAVRAILAEPLAHMTSRIYPDNLSTWNEKVPWLKRKRTAIIRRSWKNLFRSIVDEFDTSSISIFDLSLPFFESEYYRPEEVLRNPYPLALTDSEYWTFLIQGGKNVELHMATNFTNASSEFSSYQQELEAIGLTPAVDLSNRAKMKWARRRNVILHRISRSYRSEHAVVSPPNSIPQPPPRDKTYRVMLER